MSFDLSRLVDYCAERPLWCGPAMALTPLVRERGHLAITNSRVYFQPLHNVAGEGDMERLLCAVECQGGPSGTVEDEARGGGEGKGVGCDWVAESCCYWAGVLPVCVNGWLGGWEGGAARWESERRGPGVGGEAAKPAARVPHAKEHGACRSSRWS